jgi:hypothetical protein
MLVDLVDNVFRGLSLEVRRTCDHSVGWLAVGSQVN